MNRKEIEQKVFDIIADVLYVEDKSVITSEARLDQLSGEGIDSLDVMEISMRIDKEFDVYSMVEKMLTMEYVSEVVEYVMQLTYEATE